MSGEPAVCASVIGSKRGRLQLPEGVQTMDRQPRRAPGWRAAPHKRQRLQQDTPCRQVLQHAATVFAQVRAAAGADLLQFVKGEFDASAELAS